ncbi:MAG: hypothetical protein MJZ76_04625 [Bacteroidales bacterium]|nr:hypothetical protein [Bacteroidales bacterium]
MKTKIKITPMKSPFIIFVMAIFVLTCCQSKSTQPTEVSEQTDSIFKPGNPVVDWSQLDTVQYVSYYNHRFGFYVDYPNFMLKDPPPCNGDGFSCRCQGLYITGWGTHNSSPYTTLKQSIEVIAMNTCEYYVDTLLLKNNNLMVIKGRTENDEVYYMKFVNRAYLTFCLEIRYDEKYADVLDPIAIHSLESFDCSQPGEEG